MMPASIYSMGR